MANEAAERFYAERAQRVAGYASLAQRHRDVLIDLLRNDYEYNFDMLGRPIIQMPQDIVAMQELIWEVKPDLIIETGVAHGGSLILSASMLALLDYADAVSLGKPLDPRASMRRVLGIDIDIRSHNRAALEAHPMSGKIDLIQGSSIAPEIVERVRNVAREHERILVCLDSNHSHAHVLEELRVYAPLTTLGSYCCVFDTIIEDMPAELCAGRPWGKGNNARTAVYEFLRGLREKTSLGGDGQPLRFEIDSLLESKLVFSVAPDGYLRRV